ncbi:DUF3455 domain-containing protein [Reyranella soli]|jgi:hypothetical protein|uniref:DUF3455 domain-containing protein n=1 Tax=Reyranella soli TaxID=1230389 RepID=A0A512NGR9_9HYPH|nr:DUF3455 domain-containing protein [Reyranella soli]GEP58138.1 hypothetical protein RSO01_53040 [Reyranella soli]
MRWIACSLIASIVVSGVAYAADELVPPPKGAPLLLQVDADGVQIYTCEAKDQGFAWVFKAPEANLFDKQGRQIGTHFAGPSWKFADGSVVGELAARADAPASGAIPWLLLKPKSHEGSGVPANTAFIRRADTKGGAAPAAGCDAAHKGEQARIRYYALYQFFGAAK